MKKFYSIICLVWFCFSNDLLAQVSIAPTTVFIDQNGVGSLFISNPGDTPQEVSVSFLFGYPSNDESGNLTMVYGDSIREEQFGMGDRIRSFPRTFILAPQQQQTVRLQVRPDRTIAPGSYFTRIKVSSNPQTADVDQTAQSGVSTQVNFKFDQVIAAFQKVGEVGTGIDFGKITTEVSEGLIRVISDFKIVGNSPYLGSVIAVLKNENQEILAEQQQTVALYFEGKRAVELKIPENGLAKGTYEIELTYETKRADIPSTDLVQSASIKKNVILNIK